MIVALDGRALGLLGVADEIRSDAATMVHDLHEVGATKVVMLTGDAPAVASAVAAATGVDEVHAGLLPEDKLDVVVSLQRDGHTVAVALLTVGLLLAGVLFGGVTMTLGMLVHEASVLIVIANAMRLLRPRTAPTTTAPTDPHTTGPAEGSSAPRRMVRARR